jgi:hypothetical protein
MSRGRDLAREESRRKDASQFRSFMSIIIDPDTDVAGLLVHRDSVPRDNRDDPSYSTRIRFYIADKLVFEHVDGYHGKPKFPVSKSKKYLKGG